MIISNLNPLKNALPIEQQKANLNITEVKKDETFVNSLKELMTDVNNVQKQSGDLTERFIKGEPVDVHDVMIAAEKAKTSFELLLQLRNKFTDMYRELQRMQV